MITDVKPRGPDTPTLLRILRAAWGWSMRDLAGATGASTSQVSGLEAGEAALTPAMRRRIMAAYGLDEALLDPALPPSSVAVTLTGHPLAVVALRRFAGRIGVTIVDRAAGDE